MTVGEIYLLIAQNIASSIQSEDWKKATLNIQEMIPMLTQQVSI